MKASCLVLRGDRGGVDVAIDWLPPGRLQAVSDTAGIVLVVLQRRHYTAVLLPGS